MSRLTVQQAIVVIRHALDGGEPVSRTVYEILNDVGQFMFQMRPWVFLETMPATLSLIDGQSYIDLPANFVRFTAMPKATDTTTYYELHLSSMDDVLRWRLTETTDSQGLYVGCIVHLDGQPRLEIGPVPQADAVDVWTYTYLAKWTEVTAETQDLPLPQGSPVAALFLELCRAIAQGHEYDKTIGPRVGQVVAGPIYELAARADGRVHATLGTITNAPVQLMSRTVSPAHIVLQNTVTLA